MYIDNRLLSFCWEYGLYGKDLKTSSGRSIDVADPGLFDRNHGSRFFNAKLRIDGILYVGNVLVLESTDDFCSHFKDYKKESTNVILVVCNYKTKTCIDAKGCTIPVLEVEIPEKVDENASILMGNGGNEVCHQNIMQYTEQLTRLSWFAAMQTEFLEKESSYLNRFYKECGNDLEETFFVALLRGFGFVVNETTMDLLARNTSLKAMEDCRDDLFQIEAILMGQAGLLTIEPGVQCAVPEKYHKSALNEGYLAKLRNEWLYLKHKFNMRLEISKLCWHPYGNGGWIYPHVIISMLANWWYHRYSATAALEIKTAKDAMDFFNTHCTPYWNTHFIFGAESRKQEKHLSNDRKSWLIMATLVPFIFFYGRLNNNEEMCDRAFDIMEQAKVFSTAETKYFSKYGLVPSNAGEAVALTHMKTAYCNHQMKAMADTRGCLHCRFGLCFIKKH